MVERHALAPERLHALQRRVHVVDGEEDVRCRSRVVRVHAPRCTTRAEHPARTRRAGLERPPEEALIKRAALVRVRDAEFEERDHAPDATPSNAPGLGKLLLTVPSPTGWERGP